MPRPTRHTHSRVAVPVARRKLHPNDGNPTLSAKRTAAVRPHPSHLHYKPEQPPTG